MGLAGDCDQLQAAEFFRRAWNIRLRGCGAELQKQCYDHVLVEHERNAEVFENTVRYILKNPERGQLVEVWDEWPFLGAIAVGYPDFDLRDFMRW